MLRRCNFIPINGTVCYAPHTCFPMFELITLDREYGSQDDDEIKEKCVAKFRKRKEKLLGHKNARRICTYSAINLLTIHFRFVEDRDRSCPRNKKKRKRNAKNIQCPSENAE